MTDRDLKKKLAELTPKQQGDLALFLKTGVTTGAGISRDSDTLAPDN